MRNLKYKNTAIMRYFSNMDTFMQQIMSQIRAAVDSYQLIQPGDRIAVGISGGKDSLILLCTLANMRKFLPMKYDLVAITVDPCFNNIQTDFSQ